MSRSSANHTKRSSHPTRDGWIEISTRPRGVYPGGGPIPHGMGGLKYATASRKWRNVRSHPTRDGWIEIDRVIIIDQETAGPIPHGMGGLKSIATRK